MNFNARAFLAGVLFAVGFAAVTWAITQDQIWSSVYDSSNQALRIRQVP